jgi:hypothetical protein
MARGAHVRPSCLLGYGCLGWRRAPSRPRPLRPWADRPRPRAVHTKRLEPPWNPARDGPGDPLRAIELRGGGAASTSLRVVATTRRLNPPRQKTGDNGPKSRALTPRNRRGRCRSAKAVVRPEADGRLSEAGHVPRGWDWKSPRWTGQFAAQHALGIQVAGVTPVVEPLSVGAPGCRARRSMYLTDEGNRP